MTFPIKFYAGTADIIKDDNGKYHLNITFTLSFAIEQLFTCISSLMNDTLNEDTAMPTHNCSHCGEMFTSGSQLNLHLQHNPEHRCKKPETFKYRKENCYTVERATFKRLNLKYIYLVEVISTTRCSFTPRYLKREIIAESDIECYNLLCEDLGYHTTDVLDPDDLIMHSIQRSIKIGLLKEEVSRKSEVLYNPDGYTDEGTLQ